MPEMPEVETIRRSLKAIIGLKIERIQFSKLAPIETTTPSKIRRTLHHTKLITLKRHGKYLLLQNEIGHALVIHLGMSGQLLYDRRDYPPLTKHTHMIIKFANDSRLRFVDARRFGTLSLTQRIDYQDNPFLTRLGPDYDDDKLSSKIFIERCRRHPKISLKSLALHQGVAAGLGNIYACESLYRAKLDPRREVQQTSDKKLANFLEAARHTLGQGIHYGGISIRDYVNGLGHRGIMQKFLMVYDREGLSALDGQGKVYRIIQNARSTFFVPKVQK